MKKGEKETEEGKKPDKEEKEETKEGRKEGESQRRSEEREEERKEIFSRGRGGGNEGRKAWRKGSHGNQKRKKGRHRWLR